MNDLRSQHNDVILNTESLKLKLMFDFGLRRGANMTYDFLHIHKYYELFYVESGTLRIIFPNKTVSLHESELIIIPPQTIHMTSADDTVSMRYCIQFTVEATDTKGSTDKKFAELFDSQAIISTNGYTQVKLSFERLREYSMLDCCEKKYLMSACFQEIIYLVKMIYRKYLEPNQKTRKEFSSKENLVYLIDNYINKNFAGEISLSSLSEQLYLSERQTSRLVCELYGKTFTKQVIFLKMQNATKLLHDTNHTVEHIAAVVGYKSVHSFYTAFYNTFGMTPIEYRKRRSLLHIENKENDTTLQ